MKIKPATDAQEHLPLPCPGCSCFRLLYQAQDNVIRVKCEKCERDSEDPAWNFYTTEPRDRDFTERFP